MFLASDNAGPAHPQVMQAVVDANLGYVPGYGGEAAMDRVTARLRDIFEAPGAAIRLVPTGTAANALILGCLARPFETVFCTAMSHVHEDECNAPEFYTGGAKLTVVASRGGRMDPEALREAVVRQVNRGMNGPRPGVLSITQLTELGTIYDLGHISALTGIAHDAGLSCHLDGARFANALVALGCTPAEMTWKAGIDAVSFGGTKNGCLGVEACIFFEPQRAREFEARRKRGGHLFSKHRFLSAQMEGYLAGDLWLDLARQANAAAARLADRLADKPAVSLAHTPAAANMVFFDAPRRLHQSLLARGARYIMEQADADAGPGDEVITGRLVCDWSTTEETLDRFLALL